MLQLAVIGAGMWGPNLVRTLNGSEHGTLRRVVDLDPARREAIATMYPAVQVSGGAAEVFADPRIDGVVLATPTSTHFELATAALRAGKHVLVEKPITSNADEAQTLSDLADQRGLTLMVGHVFLYNPSVRAIRALLQAGELGDLHYVTMCRTNQGPVRGDVGAAWDLASHDVSMTNWWFGAPPESVTASGGSWVSDTHTDAVFATLRYPDDVLVNLTVSWLEPGKLRDVRLVGSRAMLTFDDTQPTHKVQLFRKRAPNETARDLDQHTPTIPPGEPLRLQCDHFLDCIRRGSRPLTDGHFATGVARTLAAIDRSVANHGALTTV